jgi:hypothetical protein
MASHNYNPLFIPRIKWSCITKMFQKGLFLVLVMLHVSNSYGQVIENIPKNNSKSIGGYQSEKPKKFRIGFISIGGVGFNRIPLAETDKGERVTISAGGGIGLGLDIGYTFNQAFELSAVYIYKATDLSIYTENASGGFEHGNFMVTGKFITRIKKRSSLNYGGGLGLYNAGSMDLDFSKVPDGARYVYKYKTAVGCHLLGEFQFKFGKKWSLTAGCTLYGVNYNHMKSFQVNSVSFPTDLAGSDFQSIKGSGTDIYAKISFHF